ncbi:hypothetical protein F4861DRAFT_352594 [Xylaria intraflava]|nr:hypothetical protein F4861DRAFT_352594 [Xylaria intraflava]
MPVLATPIPPLYTVYVLRSTVRQTALYIGSTPNPPRRLKQHNGVVQGGAKRTARSTRRPWEMVGLVSGFPNMVGALQFEWALNNPHVSLHIPKASRITFATKKKRRGGPRRPPHSIISIISNMHLLLRVPSFARWPLKLHFFAPEVHKVWTGHCDAVDTPLRDSIPVYTDFRPSPTAIAAAEAPRPWGIHALPLDYAPIKSYVEKTQSLYSFEREGDCVVCGESLAHGEGIYATCSNTGCEATGHVSCWSRHFLGRNAREDVIPVSGRCPSCGGEMMWGDMMMETSLRLRGQNEVDKLLKARRRRRVVVSDVESLDGGSPASRPRKTAASRSRSRSPRAKKTVGRSKRAVSRSRSASSEDETKKPRKRKAAVSRSRSTSPGDETKKPRKRKAAVSRSRRARALKAKRKSLENGKRRSQDREVRVP